MCGPMLKAVSGVGLAQKALGPLSGAGMAKAVLKKRGTKAAAAPLPGAILG